MSEGKWMIILGLIILGFGLFLGCIMETKILGFHWGTSIVVGGAAGAAIGSIIGGIGIVLCGTGIGLPAGVVFGFLGAMLTAVGSLPFFITQEHAVPPMVFIPVQIVGWLFLIAGLVNEVRTKKE